MGQYHPNPSISQLDWSLDWLNDVTCYDAMFLVKPRLVDGVRVWGGVKTFMSTWIPTQCYATDACTCTSCYATDASACTCTCTWCYATDASSCICTCTSCYAMEKDIRWRKPAHNSVIACGTTWREYPQSTNRIVLPLDMTIWRAWWHLYIYIYARLWRRRSQGPLWKSLGEICVNFKRWNVTRAQPGVKKMH